MRTTRLNDRPIAILYILRYSSCSSVVEAVKQLFYPHPSTFLYARAADAEIRQMRRGFREAEQTKPTLPVSYILCLTDETYVSREGQGFMMEGFTLSSMAGSNPFGDVAASLFDNPRVLDDRYEPDEILERDGEIDEYVQHLAPALDGHRPSNIMVYGNSGVGKTAVTKHTLGLLEEQCIREGVDLRTVHQNCNELSVYETVRHLVNAFRDKDNKFPKRGLSRSDAYEALFQEIDALADVVILVLDEIDHPDNVDSMLYELTRAESNGYITQSQLSIIGISNDQTFPEQLSEKTGQTFAERTLIFDPYDSDEIQTILESRVERAFVEDAVTEAALALCAALSAQDHGDARQALDIIREAGHIARKQRDDRVREEHVRAGKESLERGEVEDHISSLTDHQVAILESIARMDMIDDTPARTKEIHREYQSVSESYRADTLSSVKSVRNHIKALTDNGFLDEMERNDGISGGKYLIYDLNRDAEIVMNAIGDVADGLMW